MIGGARVDGSSAGASVHWRVARVPNGLDNPRWWGSITGMNKRTTLLSVVLFFLIIPGGLFAASFDPLLPLLVDLAG